MGSAGRDLSIDLALPTPPDGHAVLPAITTPDTVQTRQRHARVQGRAPSKATLDKVYDRPDFTHACEAFVNTMQGVQRRRRSQGPPRHRREGQREILVFSDVDGCEVAVPDGQWRTRVYFLGFIDLQQGPRWCLQTPPKALGALDDMWWRWVTDLRPARTRPEPKAETTSPPPGYDGPLPEGGFCIARARTTRVLILGRMFLENKKRSEARGRS